MTPRIVIETFDAELFIKDVHEQVAQSPFSRFPLLGEGIDDIKGFCT